VATLLCDKYAALSVWSWAVWMVWPLFLSIKSTNRKWNWNWCLCLNVILCLH